MIGNDVAVGDYFSFEQILGPDDIIELVKKVEPYEIARKRLVDLIKLIKDFPFTCIVENAYVDEVYRDSYYTYYASKYTYISRDCKRLSFFAKIISLEDFLCFEEREKLQEHFIGQTVIKPIYPGTIGRSLFNPKKLRIFKSFIRTTNFKVTVAGAELTVECFPFSAQDTQTMTCAQTTVWSVMEYFGTRYPEYKVILPSDIAKYVKETSCERVIPSNGLTGSQMSGLLMEFGFSPRIYWKAENKNQMEMAFNVIEFKRLFHYYVESGIPLVLGIKEPEHINIGHAVVCIGHAEKKGGVPKLQERGGIKYIDSADFYESYVIMDDNETPYLLKNFRNLTTSCDSCMQYFIVPLNKRIFLEAGDASIIAQSLFCHPKLGIAESLSCFTESQLSEDNPLVVRLFLTSSQSFQRFRAVNYGSNKQMAEIYVYLPLPKFIWVAELSFKDLYLQDKVIGEIIIDTTGTKSYPEKSVIAVHYPGHIGFRQPHESILDLLARLKRFSKEMVAAYPLYRNNLL